MSTVHAEDDKAQVYKNRVSYSLPVLLGHWSDELSIIEEKQRIALNKQRNCELLIQKMQRMVRNLLTSTELAKENPSVLYGEYYQLQACEMQNTVKPQPAGQASYGLYLSGVITEQDIQNVQHFVHGSKLTASPDRMPAVRNTFILTACHGNKDGQPVKYGDDVYFRIYASGDGCPLFVQCECSTMYTFGSHLSLRLSANADIYCRFKMLHWKPSVRDETLGTPFPPNERIIIQHTASGQNLAVEPNKWMATFFRPECAVSVNTYRDTHRMETEENMWKIVSKRNVDINLYVRAAKGEPIPEDMLN